jgi:hypothetical protein
MISQLESVEDLVIWRHRTNIKPASAIRVTKRVFSVPHRESAIASPVIQELASWLIRSGISPHANLPVSRIGIYTDFS